MTHQPIDDLTHQIARARHDAIETTCETSLVDPAQRGVLVVDGPGPGQCAVELSPDVPYGTIHYHRRDVLPA